MRDEQVAEIVSQFVKPKFPEAGFISADARTAEDFDGTPILRINTHFERRPSDPKAPVELLHEIRAELLSKGEERPVILTNEYRDQREDAEEDVG